MTAARDELAALLAARPDAPDVGMATGVIRAVHDPGRVGAGAVDVTLDDDAGTDVTCTSWTSSFDAAVAAAGRPALAGKTVVLLVIGGRYYPDCVISGGG